MILLSVTGGALGILAGHWLAALLPKFAGFRTLREKLIDPECALIGRAKMGLDHILYELGARANARETWRRVLGAKAAGDYR